MYDRSEKKIRTFNNTESFVLLLHVLTLSRTRPSSASGTSYGTVHFVGIVTNKVLLLCT